MKTTRIENRLFKAKIMLPATGSDFSSCDKDDIEPLSPYTDEELYVGVGVQDAYYTRAVNGKIDVPGILFERLRTSIAHDISVNKSDIYTVGSFKGGSCQYKAALWKNSALFQLSITYVAFCDAKEVYVSDNVTYFVGYEQCLTSTNANLWTGDFTLTLDLDDPVKSEYTAVYVEHLDISRVSGKVNWQREVKYTSSIRNDEQTEKLPLRCFSDTESGSRQLALFVE